MDYGTIKPRGSGDYVSVSYSQPESAIAKFAISFLINDSTSQEASFMWAGTLLLNNIQPTYLDDGGAPTPAYDLGSDPTDSGRSNEALRLAKDNCGSIFSAIS